MLGCVLALGLALYGLLHRQLDVQTGKKLLTVFVVSGGLVLVILGWFAGKRPKVSLQLRANHPDQPWLWCADLGGRPGGQLGAAGGFFPVGVCPLLRPRLARGALGGVAPGPLRQPGHVAGAFLPPHRAGRARVCRPDHPHGAAVRPRRLHSARPARPTRRRPRRRDSHSRPAGNRNRPFTCV